MELIALALVITSGGASKLTYRVYDSTVYSIF